ncbi:MAG TPA: gluconate 2-dehydrogenase subunit 3 family protein [Acidimicrobiales bacterium]|nr:gluconate 2-dehydrogenase subunit 3 family protein [Acidimicrobiales bacterium]
MSVARAVPAWFSDEERTVLEAACARLIPSGDTPGATEAGVADYIEGLLGAFLVDPPRIWAGGPFSGRFGGPDGFAEFQPLSRIDELAWRTRIEGSLGIPEREFNGPVRGLQQIYSDGLAELGRDFAQVSPDEQDSRLRAAKSFRRVLYDHCCEGMYGAPEYGGNRDLVGWRSIDYPGDVQPRGWTDEEVSEP